MVLGTKIYVELTYHVESKDEYFLIFLSNLLKRLRLTLSTFICVIIFLMDSVRSQSAGD